MISSCPESFIASPIRQLDHNELLIPPKGLAGFDTSYRIGIVSTDVRGFGDTDTCPPAGQRFPHVRDWAETLRAHLPVKKGLVIEQKRNSVTVHYRNVREFENRLVNALENSYSHNGRMHALLYVDLDQFKVVNDTFGHTAGDELLRQVTELLQDNIRSTDILARLGGDEFGILLEHADEDSARETAARLVSQIAGCEFCYDGSCLPLSVAIGFGMIEAGDTCDSVMRRADLAMYRDKAA
mgnify:CR=1 FL=1